MNTKENNTPKFTDKELAEIRIMKRQRLMRMALSITLGGFFCWLLWYNYDWKLPLLIAGLLWANNINQKNLR